MVRLLESLACRMPPAVACRVGTFVGAMLWQVLRLRRRVVLGNLERALGLSGASARRLGQRVYRHLGRVLIEFLRIGRLSPERARELLGEQSLQRIQATLHEGRGALILSAHLGNWDLLACAAALCGLRVNVVTRRIRSGWIDRLWMARRRACGVRLIESRGSALQLRQALQRNELVVFVLDQHQPGGVWLRFFGRPAATSTSLARLARMSGAPVVPAFLVRGAAGYRVEMQAPLPHARTDDPPGDLRANTQRYLDIIEETIRRYPDQWFWVHRRWKVPPPASSATIESPFSRSIA